LREFEEHYKINALNLDSLGIVMNEPKKSLMKHLINKFRQKNINVETVEDVKATYINLLNNLCKAVFKSERKRSNGERKRAIVFNVSALYSYMDVLQRRINLYGMDQYNRLIVESLASQCEYELTEELDISPELIMLEYDEDDYNIIVEPGYQIKANA
jgi:hypothetical protein